MAKKEKLVFQENMTAEEARAYRLSMYKPQKPKLTDAQKREKFKLFWAQTRKKYNRPKSLEGILWMHLVDIKHDEPEQFEAGLKNFGLKKNR